MTAEDAVTEARTTLARTPLGHSTRPAMLMRLSEALRARFEHAGQSGDLTEAISQGLGAIEATTPTDRARAGRHARAGALYRLRYDHHGAPTDLDAAIVHYAEAAAASPVEDPHRPTRLARWSNTLRLRFNTAGARADIDDAVTHATLARQALTAQTPNTHFVLWTLANAHWVRFERYGRPSDIDDAFELASEVLDATPDEHPNRAGRLELLSIVRQSRFDARGAAEDIDAAVDLAKQACGLSIDRQDRARALNTLANAHQLRFEIRGRDDDLDEAIEAGQSSVETTDEDSPDLPARLSNLANGYLTRFERYGLLADVDAAVRVGDQAVRLTPTADPDRAMYLSNAANAYLARHDRSANVEDLHRALERGHAALDAAPPDDFDRPAVLGNLSGAHLLRFRRLGASVDLDAAITAAEESVRTTTATNPLRPGRLAALAAAWTTTFERTAHPCDLQQGIRRATEAVAATPAQHPFMAAHVTALSLAHQQWMLAGLPAPDTNVVDVLTATAQAAVTASPTHRVNALRAAAALNRAFGRFADAAGLLTDAVGLLPSVSPREGHHGDQESTLVAHFGLPAEAVAAHCTLRDPAAALAAAEHARGIVIAAQLDARTDLDFLYRDHPDVASEFDTLRRHLNEAHRPRPHATVNDSVQRRTSWRQYDALLTRIRTLDGYGRFALPPSPSQVSAATRGAPVIVINTTAERSDAIIVTADAPPVALALPALHLADVRRAAGDIAETTTQNDTLAAELRRQRIFPPILEWLWTAAIEPILETLTTVTGTAEGAQRVCWLPIGLLTLLPLHAAGPVGQPGALDRVVSSYTASLRTLTHARARPPASHRDQLIVTAEGVPGLPGLPATAREAEALAAHSPSSVRLNGDRATPAATLSALTATTWAHFACHARTDPAQPSQAALQLHGGELAVSAISALTLETAELAYLSSCSSGYRGWEHADESIPLAAAFQLAGFRHVIANMWAVRDDVAATAARVFYGHLGTGASAGRAAQALATTVRDLRRAHPRHPHLWAGLVHSGP